MAKIKKKPSVKKKASIVGNIKRTPSNVNMNSRIPSYMIIKNEILDAETQYKVSKLTKVYFREHSNIDEILNIYVERKNKTHLCKDQFLNTIIRKVVSLKKTFYGYPYNLFHFNSVYEECIGKMLLSYPNILTLEDLKDVQDYLSSHGIKSSSINMDMENLLKDKELEYIEEKRLKVTIDKLPGYFEHSTHYALKKYYEEHNLIETIYLDDTDVEELLQISTYEKMVRKIMKDREIPDDKYESALYELFEIIKSNRQLLLNYPEFKVKPNIKLVINNLTQQQEEVVIRSKTSFYCYTNASDLIKRNKKIIPINTKQSQLYRARDRQRVFYNMYIRSRNRKMPPFHILIWTWDKQIIGQNTVVESVNQHEQPGPSKLWKEKNVTVRNNQERSREASVSLKAPEAIKRKETLASYLTTSINPSNKEQLEILKILLPQKHIILAIKNNLKKCDDYEESNWKKNKKIITTSYILTRLMERDSKFVSLLFQCSDSTKEELAEKLRVFDIDLKSSEIIGEPIATSTQTMELPEETFRPFQNLNDSSEDIMRTKKRNDVATPAIALISNDEIKVEKLSEPQVLSNDSSCQIVDHISNVIEISDEVENVDQNLLESLNNDRMDKYQQALNVETQEHQISTPTTDFVNEYNLMIFQDHQQNVTNRMKKKIPKPTKRIAYTNSESPQNDTGNNNNNNINAGYDVHLELNNFSIFLSSQLIFEYASHLKTTSSFTFSKPWQPTPTTSIDFGRSCFYFEIQRVTFRKNHNFEIFLNIPQFSLYDICINQHESIKRVLNLNEQNWNILMSNLKQLEYYSFTRICERPKKDKEFEFIIKRHLDTYFSTISNFGKFQLKSIVAENNFEFDVLSVNENRKNITKAVNFKILEKMKVFKSR